MEKNTYVVEEMTCDHCTQKIRESLSKIKAVETLDFDIDKKLVTIHSSKSVSFKKLQEHMPKGYNLKSKGQVKEKSEAKKESFSSKLKTFTPLIAVFSYVLISAGVYAIVSSSSMQGFMNGMLGFFFLYFSLFKFLDLKGFKDGFSTYDPIAKTFGFYGFVYPFIEALLGILVLLGFFRLQAYAVTVVILLSSIIGIVKQLRKGSMIQCACLGTALNLPLTKVTLFENSVMIVMAIALSIMMF